MRLHGPYIRKEQNRHLKHGGSERERNRKLQLIDRNPLFIDFSKQYNPGHVIVVGYGSFPFILQR
jgi:hypothetical protein